MAYVWSSGTATVGKVSFGNGTSKSTWKRATFVAGTVTLGDETGLVWNQPAIEDLWIWWRVLLDRLKRRVEVEQGGAMTRASFGVAGGSPLPVLCESRPTLPPPAFVLPRRFASAPFRSGLQARRPRTRHLVRHWFAPGPTG